MPILDMFGELVYSKEELKEIEKKKKAEVKKQLEEQKKKQQEEQKIQEEVKNLETSKSLLKQCLQGLIENKESNSDDIQADLDSIDGSDKSTIKKLQDKYKKELKSHQQKESEKKYKYPFILHLAGRNIETDHIFEEGKEYSESEIVSKMREHQYYDFAGKVTFEYLKNDNVLLPIFQQHKKG